MCRQLQFDYKFHKYRNWCDIGTIFFKLLGWERNVRLERKLAHYAKQRDLRYRSCTGYDGKYLNKRRQYAESTDLVVAEYVLLVTYC